MKTFRACFGCATARVRCSGGSPCERCTTRSLKCTYPTKRRSKNKSREKISRQSSIAELSEREVDFHSLSHKETSNRTEYLPQSNAAPFQTIDLPTSNANAPPETFCADPMSNPIQIYDQMAQPKTEPLMSESVHDQRSIPPFTPLSNQSTIYSNESCLLSYPDIWPRETPDHFHCEDNFDTSAVPWLDISDQVPMFQMDMIGDEGIASNFNSFSFDESMLPTLAWVPVGSKHSRSSQVNRQPESESSESSWDMLVMQPSRTHITSTDYMSETFLDAQSYHELNNSAGHPYDSGGASPLTDSVGSLGFSVESEVDSEKGLLYD